jgi:pimeloyl-ACP methyl ester carboxylesterase
MSEFAALDGLVLAYETWGNPTDAPLVLLHGKGQTRGSWGQAAAHLATDDWYVLALDLRGHGESQWAADGAYEHIDFARDISAFAAAQSRPPVLVGASLGGISALLAAGELGAPARAIVLVDIAHRVNLTGVHRIVSFATEHPRGFASVEEAADAVASYLPGRPARRDIAGLERNLRRVGDRWVWHWDPRVFEYQAGDPARHMDVTRNLAAAKRLPCPVLVIRGAWSDVLDAEIANEFVREVPGAEHVEVNAAAHMVAGHRNDRFLGALTPFLARV